MKYVAGKLQAFALASGGDKVELFWCGSDLILDFAEAFQPLIKILSERGVSRLSYEEKKLCSRKVAEFILAVVPIRGHKELVVEDVADHNCNGVGITVFVYKHVSRVFGLPTDT
jgi:hypothetical protein